MHVIRPNGPLSLCTTHYWLHESLSEARCNDTSELSRKHERAEYSRARIVDVLRRSGVDDAEDLIASLN